MDIMIDNNIFDKLYENRDGDTNVIVGLISKKIIKIYCTLVQKEELCAISTDKDKVDWSLAFCDKWVKFVAPPFAWDVPGAGWEQGSWASSAELNLYKNIKSNAKPQNHIKDKIIALSAMRIKSRTNNEVVFVTEDKNLRTALITSNSCLIIYNWDEFISEARRLSML